MIVCNVYMKFHFVVNLQTRIKRVTVAIERLMSIEVNT